LMTDSSGNVVETTEYMPFGETRVHTGTVVTNYKFTDQELDPETGLYYYGARYYDPVIGRFISPDSIVQDPFDPQMLNRYSYCRNNPLIYVDPSGHLMIGRFFKNLIEDVGEFISKHIKEIAIVVGVALVAVGAYYLLPFIAGSASPSTVLVASTAIELHLGTAVAISLPKALAAGAAVAGGTAMAVSAFGGFGGGDDGESSRRGTDDKESAVPNYDTSSSNYNYDSMIKIAPSFPQSFIDNLYSDYYSFLYDEGPSSRLDVFMKYESLAVDMVAGGKLLMGEKPLRAFIRWEAHEMPGKYRKYGKLKHLNFFGAHIYKYNWYKPWLWWK